MAGDVVSLRTGLELFPDNIPPEFKEKPRWFLWQWVFRNGKGTKPPFQPNGQAGKVNDPSTYSTYGAALHRLLEDNKYSGLGFVLSDEDDIIAWDLDHCLDPKTGKLDDWAQEIVDALNSYTEISPSGEGLRIFVKGQLPEGRRKIGKVECYQELRYVTVTGNVYLNSPLTINPNNLEIWESTFNRKLKDTKERTQSKAKKGNQLELLHEGNWKEAGYPSQSEADAAYCRYLAEETSGNAEKIDQLFRTSKLYREKWDKSHSGEGKTYGQMTIELALSQFNSRYRLTDLGNAKRFSSLIKDEVRFCQDAWYIWDGKRLEEDKLQRIYLLAQRVIDELREIARETIDREERAKIWKHMLTLESKNKLDAMISLTESQPDIAIPLEQLDANHMVFNCENGILYPDGSIHPHAFEEMITKLSPVKINGRAKCPTWEVFLEQVVPSADVRKFLQKCIGYSMTGDISEQVLFFVYGSGSNGKSTFFHIINKIFGDYASQLPVESLMATKNDQHPTVLADLRGVRFVLASEPEDGRRFNEGLLKQITGGEKIVARRMRENFFRFESTAKLWIMGNHKPTIRGTDHAIWRRIRLIPFTVVIPKEKQDKDLWGKLEAELEGILLWCIKGLKLWMNEGLEPPAEVLAATEEYREEMDSVQEFINEELETEPGHWILHAALYAKFSKRQTENNERLISSKAFSQKLKEKGYISQKRTGNQTYWQDLKFRGKGEDRQKEMMDNYQDTM
jgi:putative DNA primase/helicase